MYFMSTACGRGGGPADMNRGGGQKPDFLGAS